MLLLPLCCRCLLKFPIAGFPLWPIIKVVGKLRLTFSNLQNVGCNYYHELLIGMLYTESVDRCHGYKILSKRLINLKYCIFAYHHPHLASAGMLQLVKLWFSDLNFLYCQIATAVAELQHKNYTGENQHLDKSSEAADQNIYHGGLVRVVLCSWKFTKFFHHFIIWRSFTITWGGASVADDLVCRLCKCSYLSKNSLLLSLTCCKDVRIGYIN